MTASAAHRSVIKFSGTSTLMSSEPMSLVSGLTYRVTAAGRRVLDPLQPVEVRADGILVPATDYSLSYLFGTVTFAAAPAAPVTITANFLPMWPLAAARSFSIQCSRAALDNTPMGELGARSKQMGLIDAQVSVGHLDEDTFADDFDTGTGVLRFWDIWEADAPKLVEIRPGGDAIEVFRGWFILPSLSADAELDGLVETSIDLELAAQAGAVFYGWGSA
jgi:hypothetical protein